MSRPPNQTSNYRAHRIPLSRGRDLSAHRLGIAAVGGAVTLWVGSSIIVKTASAPAMTFAFYRLWMGFAALALYGLATRRRLTLRVLRLSIPGGVLFGLNISLFFAAVKTGSIANVTLIQALQPALVLTVAGRLFGERVGRREILWTAVSIAGVALVVTGSARGDSSSLAGDALAFAALVSWTAYFLVSKRLRNSVGTIEYFTAVLGIAGVALAPMMLLPTEGLHVVAPRDWWLMAVVALGPGTLGHLLLNWAHRYVDVSLSSIIAVAQPPLAAVAGLVFLAEGLTVLQIVGGVVTLAAVAAVVAKRREPELELEPESVP